MLQKIFVFALAAVSLTTAVFIPPTSKTAEMDLLMKQKKVFDILMYVNRDRLADSECYEIARRYDISNNLDHYTNGKDVMDYLTYLKSYGLKKDALFTYYNPEHRYEMMLLYRLFYFAKDFTTFYKTACWARMNMNSGIFTTAFTTAIGYRDDTKLIRLPGIYEIYPNIFFNSKTIRDAHRIVMTRGTTNLGRMAQVGLRKSDQDLTETVETYHLYSNFTDTCCPQYNMENKMSYFTEDVLLNGYYYYCRMMMPFWMNSKEYQNFPKELRGDLYFFIHQQLMARYNLERMSNGLGEMEDFTWDRMNLPGFYSDISYDNGISMPRRDWWNIVPMYKLKYVEKLKQLETRIMEAIDSGYIIDEMGKQVSIMTLEGLNILGNIVEGNYDSYNPKYYGSYDALARNIFGTNMDTMDKNMYIPNALQLFGSSMREPAFYRIYNRITQFYLRYKSLMKRYTKNELEFNGVRIENVEIDKLITYWENKDFLINNAIDVSTMKEGMTFNIKTWQYRLNYKPFTYKFNINSDKTTKAVVRIFLGPAIDGDKYDDYSYLLNYYKYFFMLDEFDVNLKEGMNSIDRKSTESLLFKMDSMTGKQAYKNLLQAIQGQETLTVSDRMWGFPEHLLLPKGSVDGMRYKLFCYIGPLETDKIMELPIIGKRMWYGKSLGFPLDRPMYPWFLKLDNIYLKDVYIQNLIDRDMMSGRGNSMMMNYNDMMMMGMKDYDMMRMKGWKNVDTMKDDDMNMRMRNTDRMDMMKDLHMMNI